MKKRSANRSPIHRDSSITTGEIDQYLATGDYDALFGSWPGKHIIERAQAGSAALRSRRRSAPVRRKCHGRRGFPTLI